MAERFIDLSIVIVNWKSRDYLDNCMASIVGWKTPLAYEVVVIDSGSFDGCGEMLQQRYPQVRFIQSQENLGFARANNVAFQASTGGCVLFLNPDTQIVGDALGVLCEHTRTLPRAGAIGCRLLNADGSIQTSCVQSYPTILNQIVNAEVLRRRFPRFKLWGMASLFGNQADPSSVEAISGACLMMTRSTFEEIGRFSEHYFMYAEDVDLCYKAQQAGYRNYYVPGAAVVHFGGTSSQQRPSEFSVVMMRASILDFLRKTRGDVYGMAYRLSVLIAAVGRIACLLLMLPIYVTRGDLESWNGSWRKWLAISVWSLGLKSRAA